MAITPFGLLKWYLSGCPTERIGAYGGVLTIAPVALRQISNETKGPQKGRTGLIANLPQRHRCDCQHPPVSSDFFLWDTRIDTTFNSPNGVIAMVSSLATKVHRTLHHIETDETMVCVR